MTQLDELELDKGEDAPMSMAAIPDTKTIICGINSGEDSLQSGLNQNCRKFTVADDTYVSIVLFRKCATNHSLSFRITFQASTSTLKLDAAGDDYQVCAQEQDLFQTWLIYPRKSQFSHRTTNSSLLLAQRT